MQAEIYLLPAQAPTKDDRDAECGANQVCRNDGQDISGRQIEGDTPLSTPAFETGRHVPRPCPVVIATTLIVTSFDGGVNFIEQARC